MTQMKSKKANRVWAACLTLLLTFSITFVLLEAFVLPQPIQEVPPQSVPAPAAPSEADSAPAGGEGISIEVEKVFLYETWFYIADIRVDSPDRLKTALASNVYGMNITETTTAMAQQVGAVLAINGDFYGARGDGFVVRDGVMYRDIPRDEGSKHLDYALVIDSNGDFSVIQERDYTAETLMEMDVRDTLSFGPALVVDGKMLDEALLEEIKFFEKDAPRSAIAQYGPGHYLFLVCDGRTDESEGVTIAQLAHVMEDYGVQTAYNLDGGGSCAMVYNGELLNVPADGAERKVSDIVYIA